MRRSVGRIWLLLALSIAPLSGCFFNTTVNAKIAPPAVTPTAVPVRQTVLEGQVFLPGRVLSNNSAKYQVEASGLIPLPRGSRITLETFGGNVLAQSQIYNDQGHYRIEVTGVDLPLGFVRAHWNARAIAGAPVSFSRGQTQVRADVDPVSTLRTLATKAEAAKGTALTQIGEGLQQAPTPSPALQTAADNLMLVAVVDPSKMEQILDTPANPGQNFLETVSQIVEETAAAPEAPSDIQSQLGTALTQVIEAVAEVAQTVAPTPSPGGISGPIVVTPGDYGSGNPEIFK